MSKTNYFTNCKNEEEVRSTYKELVKKYHPDIYGEKFDHPGFNLGQLKCRVLDMVDNDNFTDGTLDTCTPITLPVEIVAGAGNTDSVVLGYGAVYFGDNHDLVFEGASAPQFGDNNNLEI